MNELLADTKALVLALLGLVMTLFAFIGRRHLKDFDELKKNVQDLDENSVTRAELDKTLKQMRDDRLRMHAENRTDLQYIRRRIDSVADRR